MCRRNEILITGIIGTIWIGAISHAQIRVYDPATGKSVEAATQEGMDAAAEKGESFKRKDILPSQQVNINMTPNHIAREEGQPTKAPLGNAFIFITADMFTPELAGKIKKAKEMVGLNVEIYAEDMEPKKYFELVARAKDQADGLEFRADSGAYMAMRLNIKEYKTIYYVDAAGTRRQYDLDKDFDKFLRHVKRVKRAKGKR
ncbi:MAG: hypothetical protein OXR68_01580 [Alphaproteobacteria bacterium]|nr:hypothetical protein [Alphaproteobacteria bacterium]MDD9919303.1 hypothetical protein [Alphaproteobacteria bacterium]